MTRIPDSKRPFSHDREGSQQEVRAQIRLQNAKYTFEIQRPVWKLICKPDAFFDGKTCLLKTRDFESVAVFFDGPDHEKAAQRDKDMEIDRILETELRIKSLRFPFRGRMSERWMKRMLTDVSRWVDLPKT